MSRCGWCVVAVTLALAVAPLHGKSSPSDPSVTSLVRATTDYVSRYQEDLAFLLADEDSEQRVVSADGHMLDQRDMHGEFFITYLADIRQWAAVHDVSEVDGIPVPDREDLLTLLEEDSVESVARRLFARNARFNIGTVVRNFNEPTMALLVFNEKYASSISFSRAAVDRSEPGTTLVTLAFRERGTPTIVRGASGDVRSAGDVTIEAETGRVRHTHITLRDGPVTAELATAFAPDERLNVWVPSVFTERYTLNLKGKRETTTCESRYTNYRRFEATVRLK